MISNIPAFAMHQDYQARHSDMLAAARGEVFPDWYESHQRPSVVRPGWSVWRSCAPAEFFNETKIRWIGWDLASPWEISQG
jgi:hypothetical protein